MGQNEIITEETGKTYIIRLPSALDESLKVKVESLVPNWLLSQAQVFILDMSQVLSVEPVTYSVFAQFGQTLKKNSKRLFSFGVAEKILRQLTADGVDQVFNSTKSLGDILVKAGLATKKTQNISDHFVKPFIASTVNVLKMQANLAVTPGKPYARKDLKNADIGIAAVVTIVSPNFNGSLSIEFPVPVFLKIYELMLGEKHESINEEIQDGAGEILNMIYGQLKTTLNKENYQLDRALPTVLVGMKLRVHHDNSATSIMIPMGSTAGEFYVQVAMSEK